MGKEKRTDQPSVSGRGLLLAVVLVALVGLGASIYLSVLHWQVHNLTGHESFCAVSEEVNCETVAMSRFSTIIGVPVSTWGILFYLVFIVLALWGFFRREPGWPWSLLGLLNATAVGLSTFQFLISEFVIHSFCIMCIALCAVNATSAVLCVLGQRKSGLPVFSAAGFPLLTLTAGFGVFAAWFPRLSFGSVLWIVLGCLVIMGTVALFAAGKIGGLKKVVSSWVGDLAFVFKRPLVGGGLGFLLVGVAVALLIVTPKMYPELDDEIAFGIQDIGIGRTEEGHNWIGAEQPEVVIVEYSDYECPFCRKAHEILRQIVRERKDWLRLVHVHVPLDHSCNPMLRKPFHKHACDCARAAICADRQNRFWVMNDALFVRRCGMGAGGLTMLAEKLGLNIREFRECMKRQETEDVLQEDLAECRDVAEECRRMGRRFGTPTFIMGDKVISGLKKREFWVRLVEGQRRSSEPAPAE
jgi:uncharacterized membrane protein/predicted DsbA family dithiol-disulfide isomerase